MWDLNTLPHIRISVGGNNTPPLSCVGLRVWTNACGLVIDLDTILKFGFSLIKSYFQR